MVTGFALIGPPGCGKGTVRQKLVESGVIECAFGMSELITLAMEEDVKLRRLAAELMSGGNLLDDETTWGLLQHRLDQIPFDKEFLVDGFPRTVPQVRYIREYLLRRGFIPSFIIMQLDDVGCEARRLNRVQLGSTRSDDKQSVHVDRVMKYREQIIQIEAFLLERRSVVNFVNAEQSRENVYRDVRQIIIPEPVINKVDASSARHDEDDGA